MNTKHYKEILYLYLLFFITVIIVYSFPALLKTIYLIILLIIFYRSRKEYFWLAFVIIAESNPGGLFWAMDSENSLSLISQTSFGSLFFWMVFTILAFLKVTGRHLENPHFLKYYLPIFIFYFAGLLIVFGIYRWPSMIRMTLPWLYLIIIPKMLRTRDDFVGFFNLIFSFVPFVLAAQIISIIKGGNLAALMGGLTNEAIRYLSIDETAEALRPVDGILIPYLSLMGILYYVSLTKPMFSKKYLYGSIGLSLVSTFLTATRSWMISTGFLVIIYLLISSKQPLKLLPKLIFPAIVIFLILNYVPSLKMQSSRAVERYETVELLMKGDVTAGGTLSRLDKRAPRVMSKFYESPIIGWGYGKEGARFSDGHVGNQNLLMQTGIIGFGLFFLVWISYIRKLYKKYTFLKTNNNYKKAFILLISFLPAIFIIHSSAQWFSFLVSFSTGFTLSLLLSWANWSYWNAEKGEKKL